MSVVRNLIVVWALALAMAALPASVGAQAAAVQAGAQVNAQAGASVVDSSTLDAAAVAKLSANTSISFGARTLTVEQLRRAHAARVDRFAKASARGLQVAGKVVKVPFTLLASGLGAAKTGLTTLGKGVGSLVGVGRHAQPPSLPLLAGAFSGRGYAKDYVDFCTAAKASSCLYVPTSSFAVYDSTSATIDDTDYFATQDDCASGDGTWKNGTCHYLYPATSGVRFAASAVSQPQVQSSCIDATGAFATGFSGSVSATTYQMAPDLSTSFNSQTQTSTNATLSCVTKIFATQAN